MFAKRMRHRQAIVAVGLASIVALAGCGHDEADEAPVKGESAPSTPPSTVTETSTATSSSSEESSTPPVEGSATSEPQATQPEQTAVPEALPPLEPSDPEPVPHGQPASSEDEQAIRALLDEAGNQPSMHAYVQYLEGHTCRRLIDQNGGRLFPDVSQLPDQPFDDEMRDNIRARDVTDIRVNGADASALVTSGRGEAESTVTMRFLKEDNRWKLCD